MTHDAFFLLGFEKEKKRKRQNWNSHTKYNWQLYQSGSCMSFQGRLHFELHPSIQSLSTSPIPWLGFEPAAAWTREMWQSIIVNQDGTQNIEFKLQVHDAIYIYIYRKMSKPVDRDMAANDRDIPINDRDMAAIDRDIPVIDRDMACASEKLELAPINSGLVHVSKILTWLGTFCSLDKWNATMDHFESRWNSSKNWTRPLQRLHPSMQALSTSPRSWLGLEPSAAWTSEMRNNYGCSRTLNTVWYGVATCGSLLLASARGSKNDNRKRYAFGPCCFLRRRHILSAADHGGLGFELEKPDCGFCTPVCETNSSPNLLLSGLLISI